MPRVRIKSRKTEGGRMMGRHRSRATVIVGQDSVFKEGCARILRSANFHILGSVTCAGDLLGKVHPDPALVLFIHTGNDLGSLVEQIRLLRNSHADARIVIVADRYRAAELVTAGQLRLRPERSSSRRWRHRVRPEGRVLRL